MKKLHSHLNHKMYPILWTIILLVSIYLLFKFAVVSLTNDTGQAPRNVKEVVASGLCRTVMESASSLIGYSAKKDKEVVSLPFGLLREEIALGNFIMKDSYSFVEAEETISLSGLRTYSEDTKTGTLPLSKIGIYDIHSGALSREYILSNGRVMNERYMNYAQKGAADTGDKLDIGYIEGEIDYRYTEDDSILEDAMSSVEVINSGQYFDYTMEQLKDLNFLVRNIYTVSSGTKVTENLFNAEKLLSMDMTLKQTNDKPQILIYHTHSREAYADSRKGKVSDTVVGMGNYLKQILEERYGYNVIHDTTSYDNTNEDYLKCYNRAQVGLTKILEKYPSIEVMIDLHRDAGENKTVLIEGEETAKIMLFNGLSRDLNGPLTSLDNPNLQGNLAFSLQLQLKSMDMYPGLFNKIFLREYRYNLHFRPKSLLVELGTEKNTVQAAKNALGPFAVVLDSILRGEKPDIQ